MHAELLSESELLLLIGDSISPGNIGQLQQLQQALRQQAGSAIINSIPAYASLLVRFDPLQIAPQQFLQLAEHLLQQPVQANATAMARLVELPVCYHPDLAADLHTAAQACGISTAELAALHSGQEYRVYALGFAPGFAFSASLDERLQLPRKPQAVNVSAGAVAIAGRQTAIYPQASPGGWHVIGHCPLPMFVAGNTPPARLQPGDRLRFVAISLAQYHALREASHG